MGPSAESLALADFLISKLGLQVDRISLAYSIMDHVEVEYADELAQPSPGGQGNALSMIGANLRSIVHLATVQAESTNTVTVANIHTEARHALQLLESALAARQPVGEPVARLIEAVEGECGGLAISTETAAAILAHVFPVGQAATAYLVDGRIEQGLFFDRASADAMAAMNAGEVAPLFRSPAQAVDLAMPIAMIDQALGYLSTALDDLDSSPDRRPSVMVDEAMGCLRQALTGVPHG